MNVTRAISLIVAAGLLSACDPDYADTANQCAAGETVAVRAGYSNYIVNTDGNDYKPYFQDIYAAMQLADGEVLEDDPVDPDNPDLVPLTAADKQAAIDEILNIVNNHLNYTLNNGVIESANNPIDFIENLIATTDPGLEVGLFQEAKDQVAQGIAADDGYCSFRNGNILFEKQEIRDEFNVVIEDNEEIRINPLRMFYNPFDGIFQQDIFAQQVINPEYDTDGDDNTSSDVTTYTGFSSLEGAEFNADGFNEATIIRSTSITNQDLTKNLTITDRYNDTTVEDPLVGKIFHDLVNTYCDPVEGETNPTNFGDCPGGTQVRVPQKTICTGEINTVIPEEDRAGRELIDETNKVRVRSFDLGTNPRLQNLKRLSVEADYDTQEVKIFVSKYREAIEGTNDVDPDNPNAIFDPTDCEKQVTLDELKYPVGEDPTEGIISLTPIPDPGYDLDIVFVRDENDNIVIDPDTGEGVVDLDETTYPVPIITFRGALLPNRVPSE